jgi:flagellar hook-basal body complex protein FliE
MVTQLLNEANKDTLGSMLQKSVIGPSPGRGKEGLGPGGAPAPFSGILHQAFDRLKQLDDQASVAVKGLIDGDGTDVHTAMIATQKASLAFDTALAVRNKAVGAYQQIMGMQF